MFYILFFVFVLIVTLCGAISKAREKPQKKVCRDLRHKDNGEKLCKTEEKQPEEDEALKMACEHIDDLINGAY